MSYPLHQVYNSNYCTDYKYRCERKARFENKEVWQFQIESTGPTVEKKPIPESFASIPFEVKQRARKLYDSFDDKDMPFEGFCIELYALESPALMQADLQKIVLKKQDRNRLAFANQHNIERNLN